MTGDNAAFLEWCQRWIDLASYRGPVIPDVDRRVAAVLALWHEQVPGTWKRGPDTRLLDSSRRYCRTHPGGQRVPRGEHAIEHAILGPEPESTTTRCFGARLIDGVNAVPLAKDAAGGRAGNVEADMLLLSLDDGAYRQTLVEVKVEADHPWYAAVEALRQMRLFSESAAARDTFHKRQRDLNLPDTLPTTLAVLAHEAFYTAAGRKRKSLDATRTLLDHARSRAGVDARLATWNPTERVIHEY